MKGTPVVSWLRNLVVLSPLVQKFQRKVPNIMLHSQPQPDTLISSMKCRFISSGLERYPAVLGSNLPDEGLPKQAGQGAFSSFTLPAVV